MSLSDELRDPWGLVVAGVSGGMAWAVVGGALAAPIGLGVGVAVLGVKAVSGALLHRRQRRAPRRPEPQRPPRGTPAGRWFAQAEVAVTALDEMAAAASAGPAGRAVRAAADSADDTLLALGRVGVQLTAVEQALGRVETGHLDAELTRLSAHVQQARTAELRAEAERSAAAVRDRVEVRDRLRTARDTLLARMQAVTLGLESLVARLAEVTALTATAGGTDSAARDLDAIGSELDGLRAGLAESEAISRRVLAQAPDAAS